MLLSLWKAPDLSSGLLQTSGTSALYSLLVLVLECLSFLLLAVISGGVLCLLSSLPHLSVGLSNLQSVLVHSVSSNTLFKIWSSPF